MPQGHLAQVLRDLQLDGDPRLIVGPQTLDDAGVVLLGEAEGLPRGVELALVQTADFFPPVVDDPAYYGKIAAANALSDVYAMGGRPISALALAAFPRELPGEWIAQIQRAALEKLREAKCLLAGGHTVQGQIQFGFAVTGVVDRARMTANANVRAGDLLYLTKPLGMGTFTTAAKQGAIAWEALLPAARQMAELNDRAAAAMLAAGAKAATDVTGFGLAGHARNLANASGVTLSIEAARVPLFPGALELSRKGLNSGGAKRGRAALASEVGAASGLEEALVNLLFDAETSGGLLIAIAPERAAVLERELAARGLAACAIGRSEPRGERALEFR
jgi:selenide,water dikinase